MRDKEIQEKRMILNLSHSILSQLLKICGKPLARGSAHFVFSAFQKSQSNKGTTMEHFLSFHIPTSRPLHE